MRIELPEYMVQFLTEQEHATIVAKAKADAAFQLLAMQHGTKGKWQITDDGKAIEQVGPQE